MAQDNNMPLSICNKCGADAVEFFEYDDGITVDYENMTAEAFGQCEVCGEYISVELILTIKE